MPTLSVIIPVHNTGDILRRCLTSVTGQTLKDIEIIIVNDFSPDPQDRIISLEFSKADDRITYIERETNGFAGGARNTGLNAVSSELVTFIDSDDWIDTNAYEVAVDRMRSTQADMLVFGYKRVSVDGKTAFKQKYEPQTLEIDSETNIFRLCSSGVCNKVFKSSLFLDTDIRFPENINHEDLAVTPRLIHFSHRVSFLGDIPYHYLQRHGSANRTFTNESIDNYFKVFALLSAFMMEQGIYDAQRKHYYEMIYRSILYHCSLPDEGVTREQKSYVIRSLYSMPGIEDYLDQFTDQELDKILFPRRGSESSIRKILRYIYRRLSAGQV